jgi:hypothetical protein
MSFSLAIFNSWACPRATVNSKRSVDSALHIVDHMVRRIACENGSQTLTLGYRKSCLRNSEVRDVCNIGKSLFWGSDIAWYMTAFMFLLNNTFIRLSSPSAWWFDSNLFSGIALFR